MLTVLDCIYTDHNLWLVALAAFVCAAGSWAVVRLYERACETVGLQKIGWHFLTSVAAGASIWCTHFIAMLGFHPGVPVGFDAALTVFSLFIAMTGTAAGFFVGSLRGARFLPFLGGAIVGLSVSAMHYAGMLAYRVKGIVEWDQTLLAASILLAVALCGGAIHVTRRGKGASDTYVAAGLLVLGIVSLHFTGMAAFRVSPLLVDGSFSNPEALQALAMAVAGVGMLIVGVGLVTYLIDDSTRAASFEKLRRMAMNDGLTGLPNRTSFGEAVDHELELAEATGSKLAVIGIDLDRFKEINDVHGHAVGDEVLRGLASRLQALVRQGEFVARLGGDEFAALRRYEDQNDLLDFVARLEQALTGRIDLGAQELVVGGSIGIAIYPDNGATRSALVNNADLAMYRAKADLTAVSCFYEEEMDEAIRTRRALANDLRDAVDQGHLEVHYQVQTSISTGGIRGYEALLRWNHPVRGRISPAEFIPLAEETGLILQIGEWVLREACASAAAWRPDYKVAVNLSPVQLAQPDLSQMIAGVLAETGLDPARLELELTETAIFANRERSILVLRQIKELGVSIALDDFGTGYSSLDTLRAFAFDKIKLDRSFMNEVGTDPQSQAIIRAVLALGKSLDVPVLAEGIETEEHLAFLDAEGCDEAQGFLLGRPVPVEMLVTWGQLHMPAGEGETEYRAKSRVA